MAKGSIVSEYVKNPFFWWGIAVFLLTKFDSALIANKIMQAIWIQQFYLIILFPALGITVVLLIYPIRLGFTDYLKKKENKIRGITFMITLVMIFALEIILFFIDVLQIMSVQIPQVITNKEQLDYNLNVKDILAFLAIPILSFILFRNMKSELAKKDFEHDDTLHNNLKFVLSGIGCSAVFAVIAGLVILK